MASSGWNDILSNALRPHTYQFITSCEMFEKLNTLIKEEYEREIMNSTQIPTGRREKKLYDPMKFSEKWLKPGRRLGNTTRQADRCIQALFRGKRVKIMDHYLIGRIGGGNNHLYDVVMGRLRHEHRLPIGRIKWDPSTKIMELK